MGKTDFKGIYRQIKSEHGNITCKISYFSDKFDPNNNYVGLIIYGMNGKTSWKNFSGQAAGYNGRSFYVIIKKTDPYPDKSDVGSGMYHSYPIEQVLGSHIDNNQVLGGGFAFHQGTLKFSSPRLNQSDKQMGLNGSPAGSDGTKYLSTNEQILARFCWDQYVQKGPHAIFEIPPEIEKSILEGEKDYGHNRKAINDSRDQAKIQAGRRSKDCSGDNSS